jgi:hypothetical protein
MQKELAYRESDGVAVTLSWNTATDALSVAVHDHRTEVAFELAVAAAEALDVFDHPYAYAAFRGLETPSIALREPVYA